MSIATQRLVEYYHSDEFARDYMKLAELDPAVALKQLEAIVSHLNENIRAFGIAASETDLANQAAFVSAHMPIDQMHSYVKWYAATILQRWPAQPSSSSGSLESRIAEQRGQGCSQSLGNVRKR